MSAFILPGGDPNVEYRLLRRFPGYAVGDDGSVWSRLTTGPKPWAGKKWRRLGCTPDKDGYLKLILYRKTARTYKRVNVLILETFVGRRPSGTEGRHLNGVVTDNRVVNLCWSTHQANCADKARHGTAQRGERNPNAGAVEAQIRLVKSLLAQGVSPSEAACAAGVTRSTVYNIKYHGSWSHVES